MKERSKDISFYEWRIIAWRTSDTYLKLDSSGRGIYRDLLDQCYAQGDFEFDESLICALCNCSKESLTEQWPKMQKNFPKRRNGRHFNAHADLFRRGYFGYVEGQRKHAKDGINKRRKNKDIERVPSGNPPASLSQTNEANEANEYNKQKLTPLPLEYSEDEPGFWAERLYVRHPKKVDRDLVFQAIGKIFPNGGIPLMKQIDSAHAAKCSSESWTQDGGRFVPRLARWIEDRGWTERAVAASVAEKPLKPWNPEDHIS